MPHDTRRDPRPLHVTLTRSPNGPRKLRATSRRVLSAPESYALGRELKATRKGL